MKNIFSNISIRYSLLLISGIFVGWLLFHNKQTVVSSQQSAIEKQSTKNEIWTCAMHPQIRLNHPGKCPICGMELIPLNLSAAGSQESGNGVHMSEEAIKLSNIMTSIVSKANPVKELRLYGKIKPDEEHLQSQTSHISGRIDKLLVNFTGEQISYGQTLALVYSPDLVEAQQELLEAVKLKNTQPEFLNAARDKLRQWMLTEKQIDDIENLKKIQYDFEIKSTTAGFVLSRKVNVGDHISAGTVMYDIADLRKVWVMFDAYETDIAFIKNGDKINFTLEALPGKQFQGVVSYIDPVIDPETRVARVRVEADNKEGLLKPEMFVTGIIHTKLDTYKDMIVIPSSSVLWTGKRSIVYMKNKTQDTRHKIQEGTNDYEFIMREIELGPMLGNSYVVMSGLKEGEEIVTNGEFNIDAAAQLEGKPSMMNH